MSTHTTPGKALRMTGLVLAALLTLVLVSIPIGYLLRHSLAMMIGAATLSPFGIELRSVSGLQIGFNTISVESVRFVVIDPDDNALRQESSIENAKVTFAPRQLLQGRVQTIEIARLALFGLPDESSATASTVANMESTGTLPLADAMQLETIVAVLQSLPLNSANVNSFSMAPYFSNATVAITRDQREVSVRVATTDFNFSLQTNWHNAEFVSSYFIPDAELPNHAFPGDALTGAMRLYFRDELAASADFSLGETEDLLAVDGGVELQLSVLLPFLQHHEMVSETLADVNGTMRFTAFAKEQPTPEAEQRLSFTLSLAGDSHASGLIPFFPGDSQATFHWRAGQPLQIQGSFEPQSQHVSFDAESQSIRITVTSQGVERQLALDLADFSAQCNLKMECTATQSSTLLLPFAVSGALEVENFSAVTNAALTTTDDTFILRLDQGSHIAATTIRSGPATFNDVDLLVQETLTVELTAEGNLHAQGNRAELNLPSILYGDSRSSLVLNATDLLMHWPTRTDVNPEISAKLQIQNLSSDLLPVVFRDPVIEGTVELTNDILQINSQARLADRPVLQFIGAHSLASGTGEGLLEVPALQFGAGSQSLSQFFFNMPYEADLISGTVAASAQLRWYQDDTGQLLASGPISISADRLSGFYQEIALVDLSTNFVGELADLQFTSSDRLRMQIGSIDPGLPIENIAFDYSVNSVNSANSILEIRDVRATMFNGTLSSTGLAFDWSAPENLFALALDNIDLSSVLAMGAYEGINATGLVSGALPVRIAGSNVSVHGGTLQVQAPGGSIRYDAGTAGNSGNAALDLVNLALSNYQYDVMEAEVDYLPSGELILSVRLEGISPAVNEGQQINVNLNVTDNIPALLESLQASRNITDALQKELEER